MKGLLELVPKRLREVATLVFGNGFSVVIPLLISPFLTRIYTEVEFGVLTVFASVLIIITSFSTGRYHMAILETDSNKEAKELGQISAFIAFIVSSLVLIIIGALDFYGSRSNILVDLGKASYLIPVSVFCISVFQIMESMFNRHQKYAKMANMKIVKSGGVSGFQFGLSFISLNRYGLILGRFIGELLSALYAYSLVRKAGFFKNLSWSSFELINTGKKYSKYLTTNSLHSAITALSGNIAPLILSFYFVNEIVGAYGLSIRVSYIPVTLISQAFFQIFSREIVVRIKENNDVYKYFKKNSIQLLKIGVVPFTILLLFGPELFGFVFGSAWKISGVYAQLLTPYYFTTFLVAPLSLIPILKNRHNLALLIEVTGIIVKTGSLIIGAHYYGAFYAILFFSITSTLINLTIFFWIRSLVKN